MSDTPRTNDGKFAPRSEFQRWMREQYPMGWTDSQGTAALYGWQAGRKALEHELAEARKEAHDTRIIVGLLLRKCGEVRIPYQEIVAFDDRDALEKIDDHASQQIIVRLRPYDAAGSAK